MMYPSPINDIDKLYQRIQNVRRIIRTKLKIFEKVHNFVVRHAKALEASVTCFSQNEELFIL